MTSRWSPHKSTAPTLPREPELPRLPDPMPRCLPRCGKKIFPSAVRSRLAHAGTGRDGAPRAFQRTL
eukprot:4925634-Pyramimonas_sp.AAC.1